MKAKLKLFTLLFFVFSAVFSFSDVIDELEIQSRIIFPDGTVQTTSCEEAYASIFSLSNRVSSLETNVSYISSDYLKLNGSRAMQGNLNMGGNMITNSEGISKNGTAISFQGGVVEFTGDLLVDGAGDELRFEDRGDGKRELKLGYGLELLEGSIDLDANQITNGNAFLNIVSANTISSTNSSIVFGTRIWTNIAAGVTTRFTNTPFIDIRGSVIIRSNLTVTNSFTNFGQTAFRSNVFMTNGNFDAGSGRITALSNGETAISFANGTSFGAQSVSNWNRSTNFGLSLSSVSNNLDLTISSLASVSNHLDTLQEDFNFVSNLVTNFFATLFTGTGTTGLITSTSADTNKYLRGNGTWGVIEISNAWLKGDEVTNAIPKADSVTSISIAANAVETDEIAGEAVTIGKLSTNIFALDLTTSGASIMVRGLYGKLLPSLAGHANHVLALDADTNWTLKASEAGDMSAANFATNTRPSYWVDRAILAATSTNATGFLGKSASTNGRSDEAVVTYDEDSGTYLHRTLSGLGAGDMLRATYALNSITNALFPDYVDKAFFASFAATSRVATNATGFLGKPATTNGRVDESIVTYDTDTETYLHRGLSSLGAGDMLKATYDTDNNNKVDQIDDNVIKSNNIVNSSILGEDLANGTVTPDKTTGILATNTSFTGGDMDGTYNSLTVQKIKNHTINFGSISDGDVMAFASDGNITNRSAFSKSANRTPDSVPIISSNITIWLTNMYSKVIANDTNNGITNWTVELPELTDGAIYKLDLYYATNVPFSWSGSLLINTANTNVLITPPPIGFSSYIFEVIQGSTNIIAY